MSPPPPPPTTTTNFLPPPLLTKAKRKATNHHHRRLTSSRHRSYDRESGPSTRQKQQAPLTKLRNRQPKHRFSGSSCRPSDVDKIRLRLQPQLQRHQNSSSHPSRSRPHSPKSSNLPPSIRCRPRPLFRPRRQPIRTRLAMARLLLPSLTLRYRKDSDEAERRGSNRPLSLL